MIGSSGVVLCMIGSFDVVIIIIIIIVIIIIIIIIIIYLKPYNCKLVT